MEIICEYFKEENLVNLCISIGKNFIINYVFIEFLESDFDLF